MNEWINFGRLFSRWVGGIGRPYFDIGNDNKIEEADKDLEEIEKRRKELELRLKLIDIQGTPRGPLHG